MELGYRGSDNVAEEIRRTEAACGYSLVIDAVSFITGSLAVKYGLMRLGLVLFLICALNHLFLCWSAYHFIEIILKLRGSDSSIGDRIEEFPEVDEDVSYGLSCSDSEKIESIEENKEPEELEEKIVSATEEAITEKPKYLLFNKGILEEFDLYGYMKELCDQVSDSLHLNFRTDVEKLKVYSDKSAYRLIFENILDNEKKYLKASGTLEVTVSNDSGKVLIIFRDNGDGVNENMPERLFELNYQGNNKLSGTGLGLAQVEAIVKEWDGRVWIKSSKGEGFAIYIEMPYTQYFEGGMRK
ncbi:MAG: HAMP domain-containing histidine kinase [Lachnospiraceae bacterium]|nr:HAMP domain-containing histidine kinase [Lachnospiraceae bacterium]